jgi:hypothetical protein
MKLNAEFTPIRDGRGPIHEGHVEGEVTTIRRDIRAINRGAGMARPGAALIPGGFLLLSVP